MLFTRRALLLRVLAITAGRRGRRSLGDTHTCAPSAYSLGRQLVERDVHCRQRRSLLVELALRLGDHGGRRLVCEARPVETLLELLDPVL